jgi:hypothetical protein
MHVKPWRPRRARGRSRLQPVALPHLLERSLLLAPRKGRDVDLLDAVVQAVGMPEHTVHAAERAGPQLPAPDEVGSLRARHGQRPPTNSYLSIFSASRMLPRLASLALGGAAARAVRGALGSAASRLPELVPPVEFKSRIDTLPEGALPSSSWAARRCPGQ